MEWVKEQYKKLYDIWVPWLEDLYLRYFTRDNKASYTTRENLNKAKITNVSRIDALQDGVHGLAADQLGQGGLAGPVGDLASREGVNRVERRGKDERGEYVPQQLAGGEGTAAASAGGVGQAVAGAGNALVGAVAGGQQAAGAVKQGAEKAGDWLGFGKGME
ncbi:eed20b0c-224c-4d48-8a3b-3e12b580d220 [Thermothielavioides terrestris]|nr:eed20b0c-224c-4d48-8a3b-3e12b580d220 [Thermothielavioides terrestris]